MRYFLHHLGDAELPVLRDRDGGDPTIQVPEFEVIVNPTVLLDEVWPDLISSRINEALDTFVAQLHAEAHERSQPDCDVLLLFIRTQVTCLGADEPPHPRYDPPAEWNDDTCELEVPEGATIVDWSEAKVGWVIFTRIALQPMKSDDLREHEWETFDQLPLWRAPLPTIEVGRTSTDRARYATLVGQSIGLGTKPVGADWV